MGPSVPPAVSYTKRGQALSVESDHREEWDGARRLELSTSKGDVPASPLGVQERKKTSSAVGVSKLERVTPRAGYVQKNKKKPVHERRIKMKDALLCKLLPLQRLRFVIASSFFCGS